jgi:NTE family protein
MAGTTGQSLRLFVISVLLFLSACGPFRGAPETGGKRPKVGLVLSGGAARGFAHVGVIRALEREKIPVDLIVGAGIGSLIGAIYADKNNGAELEKIALSLDERDVFDYNFNTPTQGFVRGDRLEDFISKKLAAKEIEQLKIPFAAVATDIRNGEVVVLQSGSVARAVHASNAIPGLFVSVPYQGKFLSDGAVLDNVPVDVARKLGAQVVIAVYLGAGKKPGELSNVFEAMVQSLYLMAAESGEAKLKQADVAIRPNVSDIGLLDFSRKKELLALGADAGAAALAAIRAKLGAK